MAFTSNLTGVTQLPNSIVLAFDQSFLVAAGQDNVMDQIAQYKQVIGAKSIQLTKYARLGLATTPLSETDDLVSTALSDSAILFTPAEYGNVVTTTSLANFQTGGKADISAAQIVGINAGSTMDKLACLALDAASQVVIAGAAGTEAGMASTDVMDAVFMNKMYNKLARANVATINGMYVAIMHDDVINDLRAATGLGSWTDVVKYSMPGEALNNEVGTFKGFRILRDNNATLVDQSGAGTVDVYNSYFLGANALGKVESQPLTIVVNSGYDKLNRFANIGWKGTVAYGIVDQAAVIVGRTASSVGANAS